MLTIVTMLMMPISFEQQQQKPQKRGYRTRKAVTIIIKRGIVGLTGDVGQYLRLGTLKFTSNKSLLASVPSAGTNSLSHP
jgi:hypothetical protein